MAEFRILSKNNVNYVEVIMNKETVRVESGAMRYYQGQITMESKAPSLGGFFKAQFTGETVFKPTYTGTGKLVLEPSLFDYYMLELQNETYILDKGAYWASDGGIEVSAKMNKLTSGLLSGEGLVQTTVKGTGTVIVACPGPPEIIDLRSDRLVVDGSFAVARSDSLSFKIEKSTRSLIGSMTSGEGLVTVLEGSGRVILAPIPNQNVILADIIKSAVLAGMPSSK